MHLHHGSLKDSWPQAETLCGTAAYGPGFAPPLTSKRQPHPAASPLVPMLPIAAASLTVGLCWFCHPSSRVRSPGSFTDGVALRSQTALTGSARPWTIPQREHGPPAAAPGNCRRSTAAEADRKWQHPRGRTYGSANAQVSDGIGPAGSAFERRIAAIKPRCRLADN